MCHGSKALIPVSDFFIWTSVCAPAGTWARPELGSLASQHPLRSRGAVLTSTHWLPKPGPWEGACPPQPSGLPSAGLLSQIPSLSPLPPVLSSTPFISQQWNSLKESGCRVWAHPIFWSFGRHTTCSSVALALTPMCPDCSESALPYASQPLWSGLEGHPSASFHCDWQLASLPSSKAMASSHITHQITQNMI